MKKTKLILAISLLFVGVFAVSAFTLTNNQKTVQTEQVVKSHTKDAKCDHKKTCKGTCDKTKCNGTCDSKKECKGNCDHK